MASIVSNLYELQRQIDMKNEITQLVAAIEKLREAILFLANNMSAKEAPPPVRNGFTAYGNHMETILEPSGICDVGGISKGGRAARRQSKNDPANETALMAIFQKFYVEYPKHVGRGAAIRALRGALKIATAGQIIEGAKKFTADCKEKGIDFKYIPHPATWLNQQRWLDYSGIVEPEWEIGARIKQFRAGLERARLRGDRKAAEAISAALANDIKKLEELTQKKCEIG